MITAAQVQKAFEQLVCNTQDGDTINEVFANHVFRKQDEYVTVDIQAADPDAYALGPLVETGPSEYTMLVTVQVIVNVEKDHT